MNTVAQNERAIFCIAEMSALSHKRPKIRAALLWAVEDLGEGKVASGGLVE